MPTIKDHIAVVKAEIDATGKRLETETLTADQIVEIVNRMADLGSALHWLRSLTQSPREADIKVINQLIK